MYRSRGEPPATLIDQEYPFHVALHCDDVKLLTWKRTVIGGETALGDFVALVEGQIVERISRTFQAIALAILNGISSLVTATFGRPTYSASFLQNNRLPTR
ncbi:MULTISPECIES: hypothetical protein [unclassified Phyllobacterium]|uniref:hypothetical protein n=1 Tax=unclassified Phyllobacterium TaxID=2638441 RepID=UPI003012C759